MSIVGVELPGGYLPYGVPERHNRSPSLTVEDRPPEYIPLGTYIKMYLNRNSSTPQIEKSPLSVDDAEEVWRRNQ